MNLAPAEMARLLHIEHRELLHDLRITPIQRQIFTYLQRHPGLTTRDVRLQVFNNQKSLQLVQNYLTSLERKHYVNRRPGKVKYTEKWYALY